MKPPSRRAVRIGHWLVWPLAALTTCAVVGQASYAGFSSKVVSSGNSLAAGTVTLADDDSGSALLSLTNLKPGSTGSRCIAVTSSGSLPSAVRLYAVDAVTTRSLSTYVSWSITQGTGGSYASCSGFTALSSGSSLYSGTLAGFTSAATTYGSGLGSWSPSGTASDTRTFQFAYAVSSTTPDSAQGGTTSFGLTWEAQST